jgi:cytidylate kinase
VQGLSPALVVAIDGPSGSGKSTVARGVARELGLRYLDTGAMYRAVTWLALHEAVALDDPAALAALAERCDLRLSTTPEPVSVTVDGHDVTAAIREPDVTAAVSTVSAVPGVRTAMVGRQRALIGASGIVVEGRDIATTVAPGAPVKIFLTASEAARAQRRAHEQAAPVGDTLQALTRRDALDTGRSASPLTKAAGATVVDSTELSVEEVVDRIVGIAREALRSPAADAHPERA